MNLNMPTPRVVVTLLLAVAFIATTPLARSQELAPDVISYDELLAQVKSLVQAPKITAISFEALKGWALMDVIENESNQYNRQKFSINVVNGPMEVDVSTSRKTTWARLFFKMNKHVGCLDSAAVIAAFGPKYSTPIVMDEYYPNKRSQSAEVLINRDRFGPGPSYSFVAASGEVTHLSVDFGFSACAWNIHILRSKEGERTE